MLVGGVALGDTGERVAEGAAGRHPGAGRRPVGHAGLGGRPRVERLDVPRGRRSARLNRLASAGRRFVGRGGGLGGSLQYVIFPVSYASYTSALAADAAANPQNTTLQTAVAHLGQGNSGKDMLLTTSQFDLLTPYGLPGPVNCGAPGAIACPGGNISDGVLWHD